MCSICGSFSAITGDGPRSACWPCIYRTGHLVRHPTCVSDGELAMLLTAHGDVVELRRSSNPKVLEVWRWIGS